MGKGGTLITDDCLGPEHPAADLHQKPVQNRLVPKLHCFRRLQNPAILLGKQRAAPFPGQAVLLLLDFQPDQRSLGIIDPNPVFASPVHACSVLRHAVIHNVIKIQAANHIAVPILVFIPLHYPAQPLGQHSQIQIGYQIFFLNPKLCHSLSQNRTSPSWVIRCRD